MAQVVEREVIREPVATHSGTNSALVAVAVIGLIIVLLYLFAGPGRRFFSGASTPAISVPEQIDVNVNSGGNGGGTAPQPAAPQAPAQ